MFSKGIEPCGSPNVSDLPVDDANPYQSNTPRAMIVFWISDVPS